MDEDSGRCSGMNVDFANYIFSCNRQVRFKQKKRASLVKECPS